MRGCAVGCESLSSREVRRHGANRHGRRRPAIHKFLRPHQQIVDDGPSPAMTNRVGACRLTSRLLSVSRCRRGKSDGAAQRQSAGTHSGTLDGGPCRRALTVHADMFHCLRTFKRRSGATPTGSRHQEGAHAARARDNAGVGSTGASSEAGAGKAKTPARIVAFERGSVCEVLLRARA